MDKIKLMKTVKSSVTKEINLKYPITLSAAGLTRSLGTISVLGTGIGGTSAMRVTLKWIEIR